MKKSRRQLWSSVGGLTNFARHGGEAMSAPARASAHKKLNERLLAEIDPGRVLPEPEREKRLEAARRAYFTALALKRKRPGGKPLEKAA